MPESGAVRPWFGRGLLVLLAWLVKTTSAVSGGQRHLVHTWHEFLSNTAIAGIPGSAVLVWIALFYGWLMVLLFKFDMDEEYLGPGQVHV